MARAITIPVDIRTTRGKNEARRLRVQGKIPAVVYGSGQESLVISIDPKQVMKILRSGTGHNTIFDVAISEGETTPVMLVDWEFDPVKDTLLHADLKRIDLTKRLQVSVPIHVQGDAKGVKVEGGLLEIITREIEIDCLPDEIPEFFTIDVTELGMGGARRASEVPLSGSMKLLSPPEAVLAHVIALRAEEVPAETAVVAEGEAAATAAEPEVIKKGKKEEEGAPDEKGGKKPEEKGKKK
jgi:large subunit ribosomal protein L25